MSGRTHRLLVVEDDRELCDTLAEVLTDEGYVVDQARDGHRGLHLALTRPYDVLVVDRRLPAVDGLDMLARLRSRAVGARALVLTALGSVADRVAGLDAGADDYLTKPFELDELSARIRALCRRVDEADTLLPLGEGAIDLVTRQAVLADGTRVDLSAREHALLRALADRPAAVHTRHELRRAVFADTEAASIVDTYVYYVRRKLGRTVIRTVHGAGYRLGTL
ncbi:response regulator transcription factor [Cellulomonas wangsupingiae]|uniref:Response regulator transcription factor n=1 Tax=Cellulomonas wangsupingiae TaxID=2968085 RepID=A0ABY5K136_9CELL|nr:response regulator transcription factor [Cellulomonas wangsupingiae]MCC2333536.1 response regulator transcription factor [Cellulomonas wangsupingiae]MCM0638386.1 response regulator transcription factor [Cellulomonas wangsupingiae]UUI63720.1 response regulator transcription factor [Cellulomonas wangsupingiae]